MPGYRWTPAQSLNTLDAIIDLVKAKAVDAGWTLVSDTGTGTSRVVILRSGNDWANRNVYARLSKEDLGASGVWLKAAVAADQGFTTSVKEVGVSLKDGTAYNVQVYASPIAVFFGALDSTYNWGGFGMYAPPPDMDATVHPKPYFVVDTRVLGATTLNHREILGTSYSAGQFIDSAGNYVEGRGVYLANSYVQTYQFSVPALRLAVPVAIGKTGGTAASPAQWFGTWDGVVQVMGGGLSQGDMVVLGTKRYRVSNALVYYSQHGQVAFEVP